MTDQSGPVERDRNAFIDAIRQMEPGEFARYVDHIAAQHSPVTGGPTMPVRPRRPWSVDQLARDGAAPAASGTPTTPGAALAHLGAGCFLALMLPVAVTGLFWWPLAAVSYVVSVAYVWAAKSRGLILSSVGMTTMLISHVGVFFLLSVFLTHDSPWTWHM